ncbi:hypothetical protein B4168_3717 [Anoxybacillus flavithermus]|nr:hypothetical protein B4168_3717 [Anoxybacillus flavithermus]OAO88097.1 hypothetical protein GT23_0830 [Parageobacillus thermoglucosidasius]
MHLESGMSPKRHQCRVINGKGEGRMPVSMFVDLSKNAVRLMEDAIPFECMGVERCAYIFN